MNVEMDKEKMYKIPLVFVYIGGDGICLKFANKCIKIKGWSR